MKYFASALLAATAFAQVGPACCHTTPVSCSNPSECKSNNVAGELKIAEHIVELIDGVLVGALEVEHVTGLETCIKDVNSLASHMTTAVEDFEAGSFHKIASGIDELGHFVSGVSTTMEDCKKVGADDVAKLKKMGDAFLHPKKLIIDSAKNVLLNGVSIYDDIKTADKDLIAGSWEAAGEKFGKIGAEVIWGSDLMDLGIIQA